MKGVVAVLGVSTVSASGFLAGDYHVSNAYAHDSLVCTDPDYAINFEFSAEILSIVTGGGYTYDSASPFSATATGGSAAAKAQDLCNAASYCSVAQVSADNVITLWSQRCVEARLTGSLVSNATVSVYTKINAENSEDKFGCLDNENIKVVGAAVCAGDYHRSEANINIWEQYQDESQAAVVAADACHVSWNPSNCGFMVTNADADNNVATPAYPRSCIRLDDAAATMYSRCQDNAIHWIFGQDATAADAVFDSFLTTAQQTAIAAAGESGTDAQFCANAQTWLQGGYCTYGLDGNDADPRDADPAGLIFQAVCPSTC